MPATMTIEQKIPYTVTYTTSVGNPAQVDGIPVATVSDVALAHIDAAADGMSGFVVSDGIGEVTVTVTADADLGVGVVPIVVFDTVTITIAGAANAVFGFGTPVPK